MRQNPIIVRPNWVIGSAHTYHSQNCPKTFPGVETTTHINDKSLVLCRIGLKLYHPGTSFDQDEGPQCFIKHPARLSVVEEVLDYLSSPQELEACDPLEFWHTKSIPKGPPIVRAVKQTPASGPQM